MAKTMVKSETGKSEKMKSEDSKPKRNLGGLYLALFVAGFMLVGQSLEAFLMWKMQVRLGLALLSTALIIRLCKERILLILSLIILWGAFALSVV